MGLISKTTEVRLVKNNVEYYKNLGYEIPMREASKSTKLNLKKDYVYDTTKTITVKVEDLPNGSHALVEVLCDYCKNSVITMTYKDYNQKTKKIKKRACYNCRFLKIKESNLLKYNVESTNQLDEVKKRIGVSPQETAVAPNLSVEENLELICGIHGFSKEKTKTRIKELSEQFDLEEIMKRKAGKLSGGWQRRVSIAMALISEPQILFLDEPTLGLDVIARHELWKTIRSLKGKITIIMTTHYMEEAEKLSDRIGIMKSGKLLAVGTVEELNEKAGNTDFETTFVSIVKGETV